MKVDYFILCFGRTDFTKILVDSIRERAHFEPVITLLNNGWAPDKIPADIYNYWSTFVEEYERRGLIARVVNKPTHVGKHPLDLFSEVEFLTDSPYYFISDNDCVAPYPDKNNVKFDQYAFDVMINTQEYFWKIGFNIFRVISNDYARTFGFECSHLERLNYLEDGRFCKEVSELKDYVDITGAERIVLTADPRISLFPSDTTLSIVQKPMRVSSQNSTHCPTFTELYSLHAGYFEPFWFKNVESIKEMVLYHTVRPLMMPDFADDYKARCQKYIDNFKKLCSLGLFAELE